MKDKEKTNGDPIQAFLTLLRTESTPADCERCLAQVETYATAQQNGKDYRQQFPWIAQHLDSCVDCAQAYVHVYELIWAENNGRLAQPATIPEPDLSFLSPAPSLWETLQTALYRTQEQITLQLNAALLALLQPPASPSLARGGEDGRFGQQLLALTPEQTPEAALPFALAAYADTQNPEQCLVEVTVEPPGVSWPDLGGYKVVLQYTDREETAITDDWGIAVFPDIPQTELPQLRLEIHLNNLK